MAKKEVKSHFYVINHNFNANKFEKYDIIPYLVLAYSEAKPKDKPKTYEEFKEFICRKARNRWWCRCEYEIIIKDWPCMKDSEKIDIFYQLEMNLEVVLDILIKELNLKF